MASKVLTEQTSLLPRDPVLSFVDRAYDQSSAAVKMTVAKNLRQMVERFSACQGEFFLLIQREKDSFVRMGHGGGGLMPPHDFSYIKTTLYLGIINGELSFGEAGAPFHFPIQSPYVIGDLSSKPFLREGGGVCGLDILCGFEVMKWLKEPKKAPNMDSEGLDIAVGYEEVKELIRQYRSPFNEHHGDFPLLAPVCKMGLLLGRLLQDFPEQEALFKENKPLFEEVWKVMGK